MQAAPPEPERKQDPEELNDADRIGRACGQKGHGLGTQHCRKEEDVASAWVEEDTTQSPRKSAFRPLEGPVREQHKGVVVSYPDDAHRRASDSSGECTQGSLEVIAERADC